MPQAKEPVMIRSLITEATQRPAYWLAGARKYSAALFCEAAMAACVVGYPASEAQDVIV